MLGPDIKTAQTAIAERFLLMPIEEGETLTFGQVDVEHMRRRHVKALLARVQEKTDEGRGGKHAAAHMLRVIRKLVTVALDQEWIENDPTYKVKYRPKFFGWKAWPDAMLDKFEARWPIGTTPRLVYSLALYFGHRRSDVTNVRRADLEQNAGNVIQQKTGKALWIPMHPNLRDVLDATSLGPDYVVMTAWGEPFSPKGLTVRMRDWTSKAGMPAGYTLHGLRKTLGKALAENDATTRQLMDVLGHDNIAHAELYSRDAEQRKMATAAFEKLMNWRRPVQAG